MSDGIGMWPMVAATMRYGFTRVDEERALGGMRVSAGEFNICLFQWMGWSHE